MIVNLHIDRLVLDGLPVGTHEGPLVQAAVEAELARLIAAEGGVERFGAGRTEPTVRATIREPAAREGGGLGVQLGQTLYREIVR